jgi:hypothetical protein
MTTMKALPYALTVTLALAVPFVGLSQAARQLQPNETATNLPGATTIAAPPAGFDPLSASDEDLQYYGFPPRPNQNTNAEAYAVWERAIKASQTRVTPILEQTNIFHGPAKQNTKMGVPALGYNQFL